MRLKWVSILLLLISTPAFARTKYGQRIALLDRPAYDQEIQMGVASEPKEADRTHLSLGILVGPDYLFPTLQFGVGISEHVALGILGSYFRSADNGTLRTGFSGFATFDYYVTRHRFIGVYTQLGLGLYSLRGESASGVAQQEAPVVSGAIGWRGVTNYGFTLSFGAGVQYVIPPATKNEEIHFSGLLPFLKLEIGCGI